VLPNMRATLVCMRYAIGTSIPVVCGFDSDAIRPGRQQKFSCIFNSVSRPGRNRTAIKIPINRAFPDRWKNSYSHRYSHPLRMPSKAATRTESPHGNTPHLKFSQRHWYTLCPASAQGKALLPCPTVDESPNGRLMLNEPHLTTVFFAPSMCERVARSQFLTDGEEEQGSTGAPRDVDLPQRLNHRAHALMIGRDG
jgi:hypothetical protein